MDELIVNNLIEFWKFTGEKTNSIIEKDCCTSVLVSESDWPKRTFDLLLDSENLDQILKLSRADRIARNLVTMSPNGLADNLSLNLVMTQQNMALEANAFPNEIPDSEFIFQVMTEEDAKTFAYVATQSFGYHIGSNVIVQIYKETQSVKMFLYKEEGKALGCGVIFFDSKGNAGLHMIGTLAEARGKGIGRKVTEKLLQEALKADSKLCVLQASKLGEPIYRKLGFKPYGVLETYQVP